MTDRTEPTQDASPGSPPPAGNVRTANPRAGAKAQKADAKATRPWFKKKRWWLVAVLVIIVIAAVAGNGAGSSDNTTSDSIPASSKDKKEPELTSGQENALSAAENYLELAAFSRKGLIRQLSSDAGDGYSEADATFAADNVKVDWKEQAAKAAKNYLDISPFSRDGMIEQLSSDAGDGFTQEEAEHGADKAGL